MHPPSKSTDGCPCHGQAALPTVSQPATGATVKDIPGSMHAHPPSPRGCHGGGVAVPACPVLVRPSRGCADIQLFIAADPAVLISRGGSSRPLRQVAHKQRAGRHRPASPRRSRLSTFGTHGPVSPKGCAGEIDDRSQHWLEGRSWKIFRFKCPRTALSRALHHAPLELLVQFAACGDSARFRLWIRCRSATARRVGRQSECLWSRLGDPHGRRPTGVNRVRT
jgi:hypothetical protein